MIAACEMTDFGWMQGLIFTMASYYHQRTPTCRSSVYVTVAYRRGEHHRPDQAEARERGPPRTLRSPYRRGGHAKSSCTPRTRAGAIHPALNNLAELRRSLVTVHAPNSSSSTSNITA